MVIGTVALLLLVALVVGAVTATRRPGPVRSARPDTALDRLAVWEAAGLVSADQAATIRAHEGRTAPLAAPPAAAPAVPVPARRIPAVAEALGYIGGVLATVGLVLLLARSWDGLGTAGRLGVSGAGAAALTAAGAFVRGRDDAMARLRGFLWLLAGAATGVFAGVLVVDAADIGRRSTQVALVAGAVALHAGALWRGRPAPAQQATCLAAALTMVGGVAGERERGDVIGLALLVVAAAFVAVGLARRTVDPVLTTVIGGAGAATAGMFLADEWGGPGLVAAAAIALTMLAVALVRLGTGEGPLPAERVALGVVGLVSVPMSIPATIGWYAREAGAATGLLVAASGAVLVWLAATDRLHLAHAAEAVGGLVIVGGLAIVGVQSVGLATLAGLAGAVGLVAAGTLPERSILSIVGALALLVNVPWAIAWFFPGEGRTPALVMVTGALIVGVAVLLSHQSGRLRRELGGGHHRGAGAA